MADVVALMLEARAVLLAERLENAFDIAERITKYYVRASLQVGQLPFVFPILVALGKWKHPEVHRAHVEGAHLRARRQGGCKPFFQRHASAAPGGYVDDRVRLLFNPRQEAKENCGIWRWAPVPRITSVQV
jgi:hypothetical protein